jgi:methylglyoxal synthase
MHEEIASLVYPFREILRIQDFKVNEASIDMDDSAHQDENFNAAFAPSEMRCLALVSHNGMKATMKKFVLANKNILKKFRLTGTNSTMTMLREVFKDEKDQIVFGPSCKSGPLGGDAELVVLMCSGGLGGILFFQDPMDAHPHQADIECLVRQALVHNMMMANTPTTALMLMNVFRNALEGDGKPELIPSFFFTLESPAVEVYKAGQNKVIASHSEQANGFVSEKEAVHVNNAADFIISRLKEYQNKDTPDLDAMSIDVTSSSQASSVYFTSEKSSSLQKIDDIIEFFQHQKMKQQKKKSAVIDLTNHTILTCDSSVTSSTRDILRDIESKYKKHRNLDLPQHSTSSILRSNESARESKRRMERARSSNELREKIVRF